MSGPTVTLTFNGEESDLVKAMDHVGDSSTKMADKIGTASRDIRSHTKAFDAMAEGTDKAEQKFMGFHDVIDGGKSALEAWNDDSMSTTDKMIAMGQSAADLAGGFTSFLLPAMSNVTTFMRGGLSQAMTFISSHPLLITLGLLAAAFVLLWTHSEKFRDIVLGSFKAVGEFISGVFKGAIDGIVNAWNGVIDFFAKMPARIGQGLANLGSMIGGVFKGAVNGLVDGLNWFLDHSINWLINRINDVSGWIGIPAIPTIPHVPRMHTGGIVDGPPGSDQLRMLQAGEIVTSAGGNGSNDGLTLRLPISSSGSDWANLIMNLFRSYQIQLIDSDGRPVQVVT